MQQSPRRHPRLAGPSAMRADESVRPAQASDILAARSVAAEPLVNFLKGPWVINPRDKVTGVLHPPGLPSGLTGVKRILYFTEYLGSYLFSIVPCKYDLDMFYALLNVTYEEKHATIGKRSSEVVSRQLCPVLQHMGLK